MKSRTAKQYRQGDVLLHPVQDIPAAAKEIGGKIIVLAEGEATGHAHTISAPRKKVVPFLDETMLYLKVLEPVTVEHQEHGSIELEPGCYQVRRQVETWYDEVRQVRD